VSGTEIQPDERGATPAPTSSPKTHHEFFDVDPLLTKKEASSSGAVKMMLHNIARLETVVDEMKPFREKFHASDKLVGVLEERLKIRVAYEVLSMSMMAAGAALISFATSTWSTQPQAAILTAIGGILVIGAVVARIAKVKS
jgi:CBS domain-containing protein